MKIFALIDYFCVFYFDYPIFVSLIKQDAKNETFEKRYYFLEVISNGIYENKNDSIILTFSSTG